MNWYLAVLAGVSGGLAALVSHWVFSGERGGKFSAPISTGVLFVGFMFISHQFIAPKVEHYFFIRGVEKTFAEAPIFQTVKEFEPLLYQDLLVTAEEKYMEGTNQQDIRNALRKKLRDVAIKRTPHASDEAILAFINVTIDQLDHLSKKDPVLCYRHLFPEAEGGIDIEQDIPENLQKRELQTLEDILRTSLENKSIPQQPIPQQSDIMPFIKSLYGELHKEFGNGMAYMQTPTAGNVDKQQVCLITLQLYKKIVALPEEQSIPTLRWMFANS